jgi:hypothetical protein
MRIALTSTQPVGRKSRLVPSAGTGLWPSGSNQSRQTVAPSNDAQGRMRGESWAHERTPAQASGGMRKGAFPPYGPALLPPISSASLTVIKHPAGLFQVCSIHIGSRHSARRKLVHVPASPKRLRSFNRHDSVAHRQPQTSRIACGLIISRARPLPMIR